MGNMDLKVQVIIAVVVVISIVGIINMVRKKALELRYTLVWMATGISIFILTLFPQLLNKLSSIMGIASPMNMLFFLGFCFTLTIVFTLTVAASKVSTRLKNLAQAIALYEKEQEDKMKDINDK